MFYDALCTSEVTLDRVVYLIEMKILIIFKGMFVYSILKYMRWILENKSTNLNNKSIMILKLN